MANFPKSLSDRLTLRVRIIRSRSHEQRGPDLASERTKGRKHLSSLKQTNYACERNSIGNPKPGEGRLAGARSLVNNEVV